MLKHNDIIEKLSFKQKVVLLSDIGAFSDARYARLHLPAIKIARLSDVLAAHGLSVAELARSWNVNLIENLIFNVVSTEIRQGRGAHIYICPQIKPYLMCSSAEAFSEDSVFSAECVRAICAGISRAGALSLLSGFYLTEREAAALDNQPDERFLTEGLMNPYLRVCDAGGVIGVIVGQERLYGSYSDVNARLSAYAKDKIAVGNRCRMAYTTGAEETISAISSGVILLRGSASAIENAHSKYIVMRDAVNRGQYDTFALEESLHLGEAISDEMLDDAIDYLIDFIIEVRETTNVEPKASSADNKDDDEVASAEVLSDGSMIGEGDKSEDTSKDTETPHVDVGEDNIAIMDAALSAALSRASTESFVLLSNKKDHLPIEKRGSVAVIGAIARDGGDEVLSDFSAMFGDRLLGKAPGYDISGERNDELANEALKLASSADFVIVLLSEEQAHGRLISYLPANQLALLDALNPCRDKIIAVVSSTGCLDMRFDSLARSILLCPSFNSLNLSSLFKIIVGDSIPSGKLTRTLYYNPERYFEISEQYKRMNQNKLGVFLDYKRNFDNDDIEYHFGFGLSYSKFTYGEFTVQDKDISFAVTNNSQNTASEATGIYVGKAISDIIRPRRELRAISKVELRRGETKRVKIRNIPLASFDGGRGVMATESGHYTFSLCEDSAHEKLTQYRHIGGVKFEQDKKDMSDYIEGMSNIVDKKYYLEAKNADMKTYKKTRRRGIFSLVLAAVILACGILVGELVISLILSLLAVGVVAFGIAQLVRSKKQKAFYMLELKSSDDGADIEVIGVKSVKELFSREFVADADERRYIKAVCDDNDTSVADVSHSDLAGYGSFLASRGVILDRADSASVMTAFISSRLIMARDVSAETLNSILSLTAEYLGGKLIYEIIDDRYKTEDKLLYTTEDSLGRCPSAIQQFMNSAAEDKERAHIIFLDGIDGERIDELLSPYLRYFGNPSSENSIYTCNDEEVLKLPQNLWFVISTDRRPEKLPAYINEVATYIPPCEIIITEPTEDYAPDVNITITALTRLVQRTRNALTENEELWKKLDAVEEYVSKKKPYRMGNRFWLKIENYFAMLLAHRAEIYSDDEPKLKHELLATMDYTLATVIAPTFSSVICNDGSDEMKNLYSEIEHQFGEDNMRVCKAFFTKD